MEKDEPEIKIVCGCTIFVSIDDLIFDYFIQYEKDRVRELLLSI
jgi:hypothetical protein